MLPEEDTIAQLTTHWTVAPAPAGLAERIIAHARSLPQHQPFAVRLAIAVRHAFSEWNYALAYKGAALAAIAILGMVTSSEVADEGDLFTTATTSWAEEL